MLTPLRRIILWALLSVLVAGACSSGTRVGSGVDTDVEGGGQAALRDTTTVPETVPETTAPPQTTAPASTAPPQTTAPPTTQAPAQVFEIKIQSDNSSGHFEPRVAQVRRGTTVRWVNTDNKVHSVVSDDNQSFKSPDIPPGGSWDYVANRSGTFNYSDGTRPYALGTLQVAG